MAVEKREKEQVMRSQKKEQVMRSQKKEQVMRSQNYENSVEQVAKMQTIIDMAGSLPAGVDCTSWDFIRKANAYAEYRGVTGYAVGTVPEAIKILYERRMEVTG